MISEVDNALATLLRRDLLDAARVQVMFDPPTKEWAAKRNGPAVNLFLYDLREDTRRRGSGWFPKFNDEGKMETRNSPPRIFRLYYLLSVWGQRPEDEHRLLGNLLELLLGHDVMPRDLIASAPSPIGLAVGLPPEEDRSFADVWSALGGELKPSIDVVVSVPLEAGRPVPVGPEIDGPLEVDMSRIEPPEPVAASNGAPRRRRPPAAAAAEEPETGTPQDPKARARRPRRKT